MELQGLVGHGVRVQGKDYEIVGVTGGDAYTMGGPTVFDVFDLSDYIFYEVSRGGVAGNVIVASYNAQGVFKLRSDFVRGENAETKESNATLHIRPSETFLAPKTPNREHYTLTLQETDYSNYEELS